MIDFRRLDGAFYKNAVWKNYRKTILLSTKFVYWKFCFLNHFCSNFVSDTNNVNFVLHNMYNLFDYPSEISKMKS